MTSEALDVWLYRVGFSGSVGRSNGATFEIQKSKMAADDRVGYTKMAITSQAV